jgi:hypothetical protein
MNRLHAIRGLRTPVFLLLFGVVALMRHQGWTSRFWSIFIPLCLITWGLFLLAEQAALSSEAGLPPQPGWQPNQPSTAAWSGTAAPAEAETSTALAPLEPQELQKNFDGDQL